jgi:hypothetical protein
VHYMKTEDQCLRFRVCAAVQFMKYNAKLRNFPEEDVKNLKGNGYVTTIHAVVSGVLKLSRIWKPPADRKVPNHPRAVRQPASLLVPPIRQVCNDAVDIGCSLVLELTLVLLCGRCIAVSAGWCCRSGSGSQTSLGAEAGWSTG